MGASQAAQCRGRQNGGRGGNCIFEIKKLFSVLNCKLLITIQGSSTKDCNFY